MNNKQTKALHERARIIEIEHRYKPELDELNAKTRELEGKAKSVRISKKVYSRSNVVWQPFPASPSYVKSNALVSKIMGVPRHILKFSI